MRKIFTHDIPVDGTLYKSEWNAYDEKNQEHWRFVLRVDEDSTQAELEAEAEWWTEQKMFCGSDPKSFEKTLYGDIIKWLYRMAETNGN